MPRMVPAALLFILTVLQTAAVEDAPAASPEERARIQALIKQLGADDFAERESATRALQDLAAKAAVELEAAVKSDDVEIQRRATKLLPFTRAWKDEQAWADAMDKTWAEGLKKGELTGPLFGAVALGKDALAAVPAQDALGAKMLAPLAPDEAREDALAWLSLAQAADGSYGGTAYGAQTENRVQLTSFVLLSFLGAGHTERVGLYKANVRRAIEFLVACQRENGAILNPGWRRVDPLSHLLGGLALSEAAGMGRQPFTNEAAKKALAYTCGTLQGKRGDATYGFGRQEHAPLPDLFTTTLAVFHLKSSKVAGLTVDPEAFAGAVRFLADVEDAKNKTYSLVPGGANSPEAALMACSAHWLLGTKPEVTAPYLAKAAQALPGPSSGKDDSDLLANWMGSLTLSPQGGEIWKKWNTQMKDSLKASQRTNGLAQGSWDPSGRWTGAGRVFATALNQLCLEVFYRRQAPFNP